MAFLLSILMIVNMIGVIFLVPSIFSIVRPKFFASSLQSQDEKREEASGKKQQQVAMGTA